MNASPPTPARPFRLRFSLRVLFAVMLLVAALLGWTFNRLRARQEAIKFLLADGALVRFENEPDGVDPNAPPHDPPKSDWTANMLGEHAFARLRFVMLDRPTDEAIAKLLLCPEIQRVWLADGATDSMLEQLSQLSSLKTLSVEGDFTGKGIRWLAQLRQLRELDLSTEQEAFSSEDIHALVQLDQLVELTLISDQQGFPSEIASLKQLPKLRRLTIISRNLKDPATAERAAADLAAFKQLLDLTISGRMRINRKLSDDEVSDMRLKSLSVESEARLRAALPNCRIQLWPSDAP